MSVGREKNIFYILGLIAPIVPLLLILISILMSPWFSVTENALSDLGHALMSRAAWVFNLGLAIGGVLFAGLGFYMFSFRTSKSLSINVIFIGLFMNLVGVFDEVYGRLHFIVSVLLFLSFASFLITYGIKYRKIIPIIVAILGFIPWIIQAVYDIPRGVAIPELISVFLTLPWYYFYVRNFFKEITQYTLSAT